MIGRVPTDHLQDDTIESQEAADLDLLANVVEVPDLESMEYS